MDDLNGWNYRLVRKERAGREVTAVHEVYYNTDDEPTSRTVQPVELEGMCREDIMKRLDKLKQAFDKPVLEDAIFE